MKTLKWAPACLALLLAVILMAGLNPAGALAQRGGNSAYLHNQVGEPNGTYVLQGGSPAPGYLGSSNFLASNHNMCGQTGTYVWDQGSLAPGDPCIQGGSQNHCAIGPAACPGHLGHGSCG